MSGIDNRRIAVFHSKKYGAIYFLLTPEQIRKAREDKTYLKQLINREEHHAEHQLQAGKQ